MSPIMVFSFIPWASTALWGAFTAAAGLTGAGVFGFAKAAGGEVPRDVAR